MKQSIATVLQNRYSQYILNYSQYILNYSQSNSLLLIIGKLWIFFFELLQIPLHQGHRNITPPPVYIVEQGIGVNFLPRAKEILTESEIIFVIQIEVHYISREKLECVKKMVFFSYPREACVGA
uniref:Uncharacterized protein n=1 Tax=Megaselia scalaris TaxID=36166 RepID=T1GM91_MEGSC